LRPYILTQSQKSSGKKSKARRSKGKKGKAGGGEDYGEAVQVEPMKFMLKAPGTSRLKLKYDEPPSNFAFNFNLRR